MSCFWNHKWSKWEKKQLEAFRTDEPEKPFPVTRQERVCMECGKMEWDTICKC